MINPYKFKHFYLNKYVVRPFSKKKYYISYCYHHKALWFRVYKVATRTINHHLKEESPKGSYIYSSAVGYIPAMFKDYFKFAFVRDPKDRLFSAWKQKVVEQNYFNFSPEQHQSMQEFSNFVQWVSLLPITTCDEHLRAQTSLIDLNNLDFLGRFENFSNDFQYVAKKIGLSQYKPTHLNKSKVPKNTYEINPETEKLIKKIYEKDYRILYPHLL